MYGPDPTAAVYALIVLWNMNGDPMNPMGNSPIPNEPAFHSRRECISVLDERYAGAIDRRRGKITCAMGVK